jgi:hypothetical protein
MLVIFGGTLCAQRLRASIYPVKLACNFGVEDLNKLKAGNNTLI